jgi:putative endonuclease
MADHNELGKTGENVAIEYLKTKGYRIRHTNWRCGHLELDIVAQTSDALVFIEVKTRSNSWESPSDVVNDAKIRKIVAAADYYIQRFELDLSPRFDIIFITGRAPAFEIEHIDDAFSPPLTTYR